MAEKKHQEKRDFDMKSVCSLPASIRPDSQFPLIRSLSSSSSLPVRLGHILPGMT